MARTHPISQLDDRLREWAREIADPAELLGKVGLAALRTSMKRTHVRTGNLRRSETTRVERDRVYLGSSMEYAKVVHKVVNPYFEEGIQDAQPKIESLGEKWAKDTFERVMR